MTAAAASPQPRFVGEVTDALRTPAHQLRANAQTGRASADLLFTDRQRARTTVRTCVRRLDVADVRTCFTAVTQGAGVENVTPLRFPRGRYAVRWTVAGELVARWRFTVD